MNKRNPNVNKSLGGYIGKTVNDESVKTSSLYLTGKRNPRKPLTQKEWEKKKKKRKSK